MAGEQIVSRFFPFFPPRDVSLQHWLATWLARGCPAVATINTQLIFGADHWHHQMVYGVDGRGV